MKYNLLVSLFEKKIIASERNCSVQISRGSWQRLWVVRIFAPLSKTARARESFTRHLTKEERVTSVWIPWGVTKGILPDDEDVSIDESDKLESWRRRRIGVVMIAWNSVLIFAAYSSQKYEILYKWAWLYIFTVYWLYATVSRAFILV